ncbi:uncharacterized protein LOC129766732 [Toxorhynchites rutilus septentrionalis]|uniref:uncharacterized protein LOC129766732 n=1 Tax=Toxorhynchites rutilus septentrionalis TaxID=329112 RepID=UPI0024784FF9|nr:uncharacterized protein LOC129766732 [Toxorhynchites rutilus septentrionalis]
MEDTTDPSDISVLDAIELLSRSWINKVKSETVQNCFRKAGFSINDDDDIPLAELMRRELAAVDSAVPFDCSSSFDEYCEMDQNVICCDLMTDTDILESVEEVEKNVENSSPMELEEVQEVSADCFVITPSNVKSNLKNMSEILQSTENVPVKLFEHFFAIEQFLRDRYNLV